MIGSFQIEVDRNPLSRQLNPGAHVCVSHNVNSAEAGIHSFSAIPEYTNNHWYRATIKNDDPASFAVRHRQPAALAPHCRRYW